MRVTILLLLLVSACGVEPADEQPDERRRVAEGEGEPGEGEGEGDPGEGEGEGDPGEGEGEGDPGEGEGEGEPPPDPDPPTILQAVVNPSNVPADGGDVTLCFERAGSQGACEVGEPFNSLTTQAIFCFPSAFVSTPTIVTLTCSNEWGSDTVFLPITVDDPEPPPPPPPTCLLAASGTIVTADITASTAQDMALLRGCTEVIGDLTLNGTVITNLLDLADLVRVHGTLRIALPTANNLEGLEQLQQVGSLILDSNTVMTSLLGLSTLSTIDGDMLMLHNTTLGSLFTTPPNPNCPGCGTPMEALQFVGGMYWWGDNGTPQCRIDELRNRITVVGNVMYNDNNTQCF